VTTEGDERLRRCFAAVFPTLPPDEIPTASIDTVAEWDSLAAVTLAALVEEEFDVEIPDEALSELTSFAAVGDFLRSVHRLP
jgi:acyl carrier protein